MASVCEPMRVASARARIRVWRKQRMQIKMYCKKCGAWYKIDEVEITIGSEVKENSEQAEKNKNVP